MQRVPVINYHAGMRTDSSPKVGGIDLSGVLSLAYGSDHKSGSRDSNGGVELIHGVKCNID